MLLRCCRAFKTTRGEQHHGRRATAAHRKQHQGRATRNNTDEHRAAGGVVPERRGTDHKIGSSNDARLDIRALELDNTGDGASAAVRRADPGWICPVDHVWTIIFGFLEGAREGADTIN